EFVAGLSKPPRYSAEGACLSSREMQISVVPSAFVLRRILLDILQVGHPEPKIRSGLAAPKTPRKIFVRFKTHIQKEQTQAGPGQGCAEFHAYALEECFTFRAATVGRKK